MQTTSRHNGKMGGGGNNGGLALKIVSYPA